MWDKTNSKLWGLGNVFWAILLGLPVCNPPPHRPKQFSPPPQLRLPASKLRGTKMLTYCLFPGRNRIPQWRTSGQKWARHSQTGFRGLWRASRGCKDFKMSGQKVCSNPTANSLTLQLETHGGSGAGGKPAASDLWSFKGWPTRCLREDPLDRQPDAGIQQHPSLNLGTPCSHH